VQAMSSGKNGWTTQKILTDVETWYMDYRNIDGVMTPFFINTKTASGITTTIYTQLKNNVAIDDAIFKMPKGLRVVVISREALGWFSRNRAAYRLRSAARASDVASRHLGTTPTRFAGLPSFKRRGVVVVLTPTLLPLTIWTGLVYDHPFFGVSRSKFIVGPCQ